MVIQVLTGILVLITGVYAWVTFKILEANESVVREMQRQSEDIARPRISIFVHALPSRPMFQLTVRNVGMSSASNLSMKMNRSFIAEHNNKDIASIAAFTKIIPSFAPHETIDIQLGKTFVILSDDKDEELRPLQFAIEATYYFGSRHYVETTHIDLSVQMDTSLITDAIVEQMDRMNKTLKNIAER